MRCVEFDLEGDIVRCDVWTAVESSAGFAVQRVRRRGAMCLAFAGGLSRAMACVRVR